MGEDSSLETAPCARVSALCSSCVTGLQVLLSVRLDHFTAWPPGYGKVLENVQMNQI